MTQLATGRHTPFSVTLSRLVRVVISTLDVSDYAFFNTYLINLQCVRALEYRTTIIAGLMGSDMVEHGPPVRARSCPPATWATWSFIMLSTRATALLPLFLSLALCSYRDLIPVSPRRVSSFTGF